MHMDQVVKTPPFLARVLFDNTDENWTIWGTLVNGWIASKTARPKDTQALTTQMRNAGIANPAIPGNDRTVRFYDLEQDEDEGAADPNPFVLYLPNGPMLQAKKDALDPKMPYPMPSFYKAIFGVPPLTITDAAQRDRIVLQRIGEYTINMCA